MDPEAPTQPPTEPWPDRPLGVLGLSDDQIPSIEGYSVVCKIGGGGMGLVFEAYELDGLKRRVAIKVMRPMQSLLPRAAERFIHEYEVLASLDDHIALMRVYKGGRDPVVGPFYVMQFAEKPGNLRQEAAALRLVDRLRMFIKVCEGVDYANRSGVLHLDLKPANILVDQHGQPKIIDFGLARAIRMSDSAGPGAKGPAIGTWAYMSPEQAEGDLARCGPESDVYALGMVLYELAAGEPAYRLGSDLSAARRTIAESVPSAPGLKNPEIDADLDSIILRALAKKPRDRYESAGEFGRTVQGWIDGLTVKAAARVEDRLQRRAARNRLRLLRLVILVVAVIVGVVAADWPLVPLAYRWTGLNQALVAAFTRDPQGPMERVRVVGWSDSTDFESVAATLGVPGVSNHSAWTRRALYGRLMEALVVANPAAVGWDVAFVDNPEAYGADRAFGAGVEALRTEGIEVVVATENWERGAGGIPFLSPVVLEHVKRWGGTTITGPHESEPWKLDLLIQRDRVGETMTSLALEVYGAARHADAYLSARVLANRASVELDFWKPHPGQPNARELIGKPDVLPMTGATELMRLENENAKSGFLVGDLMPVVLCRIPDDAGLRAVTVAIEDVAALVNAKDIRRLGELFKDRVILFGTLETEVDRHDYPDGRDINGVYAHASAVEAMLSGAVVRVTTARQDFWLAVAAAVAGVAVVAWPGAWRWRRWVAAAACVLVWIVVTLVAFRFWGLLVDPYVQMGVAVVSMAAAWIGVRMLVDRNLESVLSESGRVGAQ